MLFCMYLDFNDCKELAWWEGPESLYCVVCTITHVCPVLTMFSSASRASDSKDGRRILWVCADHRTRYVALGHASCVGGGWKVESRAPVLC